MGYRRHKTNKRILRDAGLDPGRRFWESDEQYHRRLRQTADQQIVHETDGDVTRGLLESDRHYDARMYSAAEQNYPLYRAQHPVDEPANDASGGLGAVLLGGFVAVLVVAWLLGKFFETAVGRGVATALGVAGLLLILAVICLPAVAILWLTRGKAGFLSRLKSHRSLWIAGALGGAAMVTSQVSARVADGGWPYTSWTEWVPEFGSFIPAALTVIVLVDLAQRVVHWGRTRRNPRAV